MLTPKLRYISKTRPFLCPLLSNSYSSSSSAHRFTNPPITRYQFNTPSSESKEITSSFLNWFRTSKKPVIDRILSVLNSKSDEDLEYLNKSDLGIGQLGITLTEEFVLEVLRYKKDDVLSCLKFFDWVGRQQNFHHTHATFVAIFKIMRSAKLTSLMVDLLDSFTERRGLHRVRFHGMLVMGYALAGKIDVALQVFGKMRFHGHDLDNVGYHILLNSCVEEDCYDVANVLLKQIRMRGHQTKVTHGIVMKSLCRQGKLVEAEDYLRWLVREKKVLEGHDLGTLVDALCRHKSFSHAGDLIQEFGELGAVSLQDAYGVWIKTLVLAGNFDAAVEFFRNKKSAEGYIPDVFRYNVLICRLLKENRLNDVCDLLLDMKEGQVVPDKVTMNAVLCFFCKAGMMDVALDLYDFNAEFELTPHSLVCNYVINTLCGDGDGGVDEAYQILTNSMKQGYFPGRRTFSILTDALCREGKLDQIKGLIMLSLEHKFIPPDSAYEKLIRALCRAKRVEEGFLIYEEFNRSNKTPNESTYSYLIGSFNCDRRGDLAAKLLIEMQDKGHVPSPKLFKSVIRCVCKMDDPEKYFLHLLETQLSRFGANPRILSYFIFGAGAGKRSELGIAVYEMIQRIGFAPNLSSDLYMLQCFLHCGKIADALSFFDDLNRRRRVKRKIYNTMVVGLCRCGKADFALAILNKARNDGIIPSLQSYEELIQLYCSENNYDYAIKLIIDLEKVGRRVSSFVGNTLLLHAMLSGDLYKTWLRSRDVLNEIPSSAMLGQLIHVFSSHVELESSGEDLEDVIKKCFPLDIFSYNMMLRKLSINKIDEACQVLKRLCHKGFQPNRWTYDIIVHGFFKHGRTTEAELWADQMLQRGFVPTECTRRYI